MKLQTRATGVLERTSHYLRAGVIKSKPAWYDAVAAHPPGYDLAKKPKTLAYDQQADPASGLWAREGKYRKTRAVAAERRQSNNRVSRIPKLEFLEDQLRDVFYHQHPWEFARPKVVVENGGTEHAACDWSHMLQLGRPLDGESVVQRTLWLLQRAKERGAEVSLFDAYDEARFEFYQLRMAEEMAATVAREELAMFGAVYASTHMAWGVAQEQQHVDEWARVGEEKTKRLEALRTRVDLSMGTEAAEPTASVWETTE